MAEVSFDEYVEELAWVVGNDLKEAARDDKEYGFDPITILTIIKIIIEIIQWFRENYDKDNPEELAKRFGKLNPFQKWILWRSVRKESETRKEAKYIYRSMTKLTGDMTLEARTKLFKLKEST
jgi:hypothetical protein